MILIQGFCIPSELQEAAAKLEATKFEDIEDGGFGEGEGTKDVSSKLESEDQLDEAMKEGEEKKEDESNDKDLKVFLIIIHVTRIYLLNMPLMDFLHKVLLKWSRNIS